MTSNKLNLEVIDGIQEINDATVANCNGCFEIVLWSGSDFGAGGGDGLRGLDTNCIIADLAFTN